jgi:cell shape-determining protein MreD
MRWTLFALVAFFACALDAGIEPLIVINVAGYDVFPSFMLLLTGFVALWASQASALWAGLILGLLTDCLVRLPGTDSRQVIALVGPNALGFLLAAYTVVQIRGVFKRESALALAICVFLAGIMALLMTVMIITARGLYTEPIPGWHGLGQLARGMMCLVYTSLLALPLGWLLGKTLPIWGFENAGPSTGRRQPPP